jgi:phospholipid/cholesterol/gamma-HCH transport system substrate-binding protein
VLGNLPQFAADATDITRVLDIQHNAVVSLVQNGGTVFAALTQDQNALRNLITTSATTFRTTAANNNALADTFHVFPTFLDETKATMTRLKAFAIDTDPLIKALNPVAQQLTPTLQSVRRLSPDLRRLFINLGPLITASKTGLPAFADVLTGAKPLLGQLGPFLEELNPILSWLSLHQQLISDFISNGATGVSSKAIAVSGGGLACEKGIPCHYLRQFQPAGITSLGFFKSRVSSNRGNVYPPPLWLQGPALATHGAPPSWDCANTGAGGDGSVAANTTPGAGFPACWVAPPQGALLGQKQKFAHVTRAHYSSK